MYNPRLVIENLSKSYPNGRSELRPVLENVSFSQQIGEFVTILGPNGAGKTTLLKILAGLEDFESGRILFDGQPLKQTDIKRTMVFQDHGLFDWMTVADNIAFGLKAKGVPRHEREQIVSHYIELVELTGHENKFPHELSGGLSQRTAIARALAVRPKLLLMDEPFASLDIDIRRRLQQQLLAIWQQEQLQLVFVTHDIEEAVLLSDRVVLLSARPGRIRKNIKINLPRPRSNSLRFDPRFRQCVEELEAAYYLDEERRL
jgi:NitT/TauT family transport system ATP-binding protein